MERGAVAALVAGIAFLIFPALLGRNLVRRWRRLTSWPRAEARVRHVWRTKEQTSNGRETVVHARYEFRDAAGRIRVGEVDYLSDPQVDDFFEVMFDPDDLKVSEPVSGGSVVGRIVIGTMCFLFGALGIFLILASLDLISA